MKNEIKYINYVRALCMLWIVAFWHLGGVTHLISSNSMTLLFTKGVLATFTYLSGYLMAGKEICFPKGVLSFYKKRILRVYPLFLLSAIMFYIFYLKDPSFVYLTSLRQLALTIIGFSVILPPAAGTLWFLNMLFIFWALTPLILSVKSHGSKVLMGCAIYIVLLIGLLLGNDDRLLLYFVNYMIGLLNRNSCTSNTKNFRLAYSVFVFGAACYLSGKTSNLAAIYCVELISNSAVVSILLNIGKVIDKMSHSVFHSALDILSYISMTAYLFHNQIYELVYWGHGPPHNIYGLWICTAACADICILYPSRI